MRAENFSVASHTMMTSIRVCNTNLKTTSLWNRLLLLLIIIKVRLHWS